ncbi:primosomal protein N' [Phreatobacter aquaticus]|uniref:Replication restart protein PriA n=1 Tax=Phreatobacter aquaticus TaxID=2570229 RepID=A0A4D7QGE3_9HYPH|nr:primosomal protein N' [Phreatobacter aquaticus]QCK86258.1 primosomal protein N' [Phreatobacter aquaticus]
MTAPRYADVLIPVAIDRPYSYRVPAELELGPGDVVSVPLGNRTALGVVWQLRDDPGGVSHNRLKDVLARYEVPAVPAAIRRLVDWIADYTLSPRGMVLRMAVRDPDHLAPPRPRIGVRLTGQPPSRPTSARTKLMALMADGLARAKGEAAKEAGVSIGVVDGLIDDGALEAITLPPESVAETLDPDHARPALNPAQHEAAQVLADGVAARAFQVYLVDGVTGSGKTEVYFEAVAEAIRQGRQTLILVPEIALTTQFLDRFAERFGHRPAAWHSGVGQARRGRVWTGVAAGEVPVVIGARSALFLPFQDLGLIIVDEEHEGAYKQDDGVHYHARDMAVVRGRMEAIPVVLASATPSLESRVNADKGRYRRLILPERFGGREMPAISTVDMKVQGPPRGRWISPALELAMRRTLEEKEQSLIFLNRRGYAPLTLCRTCGERIQCPNCSAWLVDHRFRRRLVCHHCGFSMPPLEHCPKCDAVDSFVACGPGVERMAEECATLFPEARLLVLSSDMAGGIERIRQEIEAVAKGEADIVIGTQLIAKGHNFPHLALVGVVDADLGLQNGDPRAGERTFQLLQQVVGRAGRAKDGSRALIQTHRPDHPIIDAIVKGDREAFYEAEIAMREEAQLPPHGRLAALVVSAEAQSDAMAYARMLVRSSPASKDVKVLGPAEAPLALVRGRHRMRILARSPRAFDLSGWLRDWLSKVEAPRGNVRLEIDVDPQSFL